MSSSPAWNGSGQSSRSVKRRINSLHWPTGHIRKSSQWKIHTMPSDLLAKSVIQVILYVFPLPAQAGINTRIMKRGAIILKKDSVIWKTEIRRRADGKTSGYQ